MVHKEVLCRIYLAYISKTHLGFPANFPYIFVMFELNYDFLVIFSCKSQMQNFTEIRASGSHSDTSVQTDRQTGRGT